MVMITSKGGLGAPAAAPAAGGAPKKRRRGFLPILLVLLVVLGLVGGGYWFFKIRPHQIKSGTYQAVFLSNGQVYFGRMAGGGPQYARLSDVYYLSSVREATDSAKVRQQLRKLGSELHGPEDSMVINRKHILFTENLKGDAAVIKAIKQHKAQQAQGGQK